jgi:hypothetical protein
MQTKRTIVNDKWKDRCRYFIFIILPQYLVVGGRGGGWRKYHKNSSSIVSHVKMEWISKKKAASFWNENSNCASLIWNRALIATLWCLVSTVQPFTALYKIILFKMHSRLPRRSNNVQFENLTMEVLITVLVTLQITENFLCNFLMMLSVLQTKYCWVTGW